MHQLENHLQIPTTPHCLNYHHKHNVLCSWSGEELDLLLAFKLSWIGVVFFVQQRQPHCQGSWLAPDRPACPHCCRLLMTSWALGKDIGRDSPFHVGLHTLDTKQHINLNLNLLSHVLRQYQSGAWNVAYTSSRKALYHTGHLQGILYLMSVYEIKLFYTL